MLKKLLSLSCVLCFFTSLAQIKGTIADSETKQPIPYVNIWILNEDIGTTADGNGNFTIQAGISKSIVFSAVGYGDITVKASDVTGTVYMEIKAIELDNVVITPRKNRLFRTVNPIDKEMERETYFGLSTTVQPRMAARFIPFRKEYADTAFLKDIKFVTFSRSPGSTFNVRLYGVGEDGSPGDLLYDENIIGTAKKKKSITTVDLSALNIRIPEKGFFIALEWLIIDSNRYDLISSKYGKALDKKGKRYTIYYDPPFKCCYTDKRSSVWNYAGGVWNHTENIHNNQYYTFFAELTLSN